MQKQTARILRAALAALATLGMAASASAKTFNLDPGSKYGLIVVQADQVAGLGAGPSYDLNVISYDPNRHAVTANGFGGIISLTHADAEKGPAIIVAQAPSGTYVVSGLWQRLWATDFAKATDYFEVKPGQVVFLGRLRAQGAIDDMNTAVKDGRLPRTSTNGRRAGLSSVSRLDLTTPDLLPGWKAEIGAFLSANQPQVHGDLVAADLKPVDLIQK